MNTRELENDEFNMLKALTCFISSPSGNAEKLKNYSFLRGIRGYFWEGLDDYLSHEVKNKNNQTAQIQEIMDILKLENSILKFNSESKLNQNEEEKRIRNLSKSKLGKLKIAVILSISELIKFIIDFNF